MLTELNKHLQKFHARYVHEEVFDLPDVSVATVSELDGQLASTQSARRLASLIALRREGALDDARFASLKHHSLTLAARESSGRDQDTLE